MTEQQAANLAKGRKGRPVGQFGYHKLCVLKFLQDHQNTNGTPYDGSNADLSVCMGEWGKKWRVGVSERQVARYLQALRKETIPGTETPRITVFIEKVYYPMDRAVRSKRTIYVNDMRPLNLY